MIVVMFILKVLSYSLLTCLLWDEAKRQYTKFWKRKEAFSMILALLDMGEIRNSRGREFYYLSSQEDIGFSFVGNMLSVVYKGDIYKYVIGNKLVEMFRQKVIKYTLKKGVS